MENLIWVVVGLLFVVLYQLNKMSEKLENIQQDQMSLDEKLFPDEWKSEE